MTALVTLYLNVYFICRSIWAVVGRGHPHLMMIWSKAHFHLYLCDNWSVGTNPGSTIRAWKCAILRERLFFFF